MCLPNGCTEINPKLHHYEACKYYQVLCKSCDQTFESRIEYAKHDCILKGTHKKIKLVDIELSQTIILNKVGFDTELFIADKDEYYYY